MVKTISADEVIRMHSELEAVYRGSGDPISPPGVKNRGLLEAAVARPWTGMGGQQEHFPGLELKAAILAWSLVCYHPFHNGNKRTAIAAMRLLLQKNERALLARSSDLLELADLAASLCQDRSDAPYGTLSDWVSNHSRVRPSLKPRRWRDVLAELKAFGISWSQRHGFIHLKTTEGPVLTLAFRGLTSEAEPSSLRTICKFFALLLLSEVDDGGLAVFAPAG